MLRPVPREDTSQGLSLLGFKKTVEGQSYRVGVGDLCELLNPPANKIMLPLEILHKFI